MQNQWYIARDGKQYGPINDVDLEQLVRNRELLDGDFLWRNGFENWLPAAQVPEVRLLASKGAQHQPQQPLSQQPLSQQPLSQQHQGFDPKMMSPYGGEANFGHQETGFRRQEQAPYQQGPDQHGMNQNAFEGDRFDQKRDELRRSLHQQDYQTERAFGQQGALAVTAADENPTDGFQHMNGDLAEAAGPDVRQGALNEADEVEELVEVVDAEFSTQPDVLKKQQEGFKAGHFQASGQQPYEQAALQRRDGGRPFENAPYERGAYDPGQMTANPVDQTKKDRFSARQAGRAAMESVGRGPFRVSWLLGAGMAVAIIFVLLVGATFALPFIVPPETIKKQISAAIKQQSGRDVSFKGKMSYRFLPSFGLDLNNIVIHNPPNIKGPDFVTIGRLQANLKLLPLLGKSVEIEQIVLHRPEIVLIDDGKGATNYKLKSAERLKRRLPSFKVAQQETLDTSDIIARTLEQLEKEEENAKKEGEETSPEKAVDPTGPVVTEKETHASSKIQVGEIEIINGVVRLINQKENSETELKAINLKVQAPGPDKDITAKGSVRFREDRIDLNAQLSTLGNLMSGEPVKTTIAATSDRFEGKFEGMVRNQKGLEYQGQTDIQTFSLQNLMNWFGVDVPRQGYGGAYVRGRLLGNADTILLKSATLKVDQSTLIGDLRLSTQHARPRFEAILRTDLLNLNPYLGQKAEIKRTDLPGGGKTAVAAWSSEKIDLAVLQKFDAGVQIDAGQLDAFGHTVKKARLNAKMNAGLVTAQLPNFEIYGGTGALSLALNGAKARPSLKTQINLKKVQMKPFLMKSAGLEFLSGLADITLDITSTGQSQKELVSALQGTGKVEVLDGAIEGINLAGAMRKLQAGDLSSLSGGAAEKTDFSEMTASFKIEQGLVKNEDLTMKGPLVRMEGQGVVNLPAEQIDFGLQPKLVASLRGQGGETGLKGLQIPLRVKGPLANPKIIPDGKGLLKNNAEAIDETVETVKKAVKDLKKKKISGEEMKNLLDGMINGDGESGNLLDGVLQ